MFMCCRVAALLCCLRFKFFDFADEWCFIWFWSRTDLVSLLVRMCDSGLVDRKLLLAIAEYTLANLHGVEASALHVLLESSSVAATVVTNFLTLKSSIGCVFYLKF